MYAFSSSSAFVKRAKRRSFCVKASIEVSKGEVGGAGHGGSPPALLIRFFRRTIKPGAAPSSLPAVKGWVAV